jgi:hypothetical protein
MPAGLRNAIGAFPSVTSEGASSKKLMPNRKLESGDSNMKKLATLTTMAFLLSTVFAFAQAPANQDKPAASTTKTTKKQPKGQKKSSAKKTTTTAPAAEK